MRPEAPRDASFDTVVAPAGEGRIARSWRLAKIALRLAAHDRTILWLALLSVLTTAAAAALIFGSGAVLAADNDSDAILIAAGALAGYVVTYVSVFFNVALAAAAYEAFDGRRLTLNEALAIPTLRLGTVALWALIAATVGVLLRQLAERIPFGGALLEWLFGVIWSLATIFVIPVLALEERGPVDSFKRSARLIRERWGESAIGTLAIEAWLIIAVIPCSLLFVVAGATTDPGAAIFLLVLGFLGILAAIVAQGVVRQVYAVALYRYATADIADGGFDEADLARPFTKRRSALRRMLGR